MENGDLGDIGRNLILLVPIILIILLNIFLRRRRGQRTQPEIVSSLLSEIALNQQMAETLVQQGRATKLKTGSWQRNNSKLDFLSQELQDELAKTFSMAEEFNRAVDAARKYKSSSYLVGIPVDKLKEALARSRHGLEEWVESNRDQIMMTPGRRGCLSP